MRIKKYACHRIYKGSKSFLAQSVVSVASDGKVIACTPLSEEIASTEWIGGIVVLSNQSEIACRQNFPKWIYQSVVDNQFPIYAWHISDFDFQQENLTERSIIRRL